MSTLGKRWKVPIRAVAPQRLMAVADVAPCVKCGEPCTRGGRTRGGQRCRPCAEQKRKADKLVLHTDVSGLWTPIGWDY